MDYAYTGFLAGGRWQINSIDPSINENSGIGISTIVIARELKPPRRHSGE